MPPGNSPEFCVIAGTHFYFQFCTPLCDIKNPFLLSYWYALSSENRHVDAFPNQCLFSCTQQQKYHLPLEAFSDHPCQEQSCQQNHSNRSSSIRNLSLGIHANSILISTCLKFLEGITFHMMPLWHDALPGAETWPVTLQGFSNCFMLPLSKARQSQRR